MNRRQLGTLRNASHKKIFISPNLSPHGYELSVSSLKVLQQRSPKGGGPNGCLPPLSKYEIIGLETSEHTDGRVHFTGLIETVLDVHSTRDLGELFMVIESAVGPVP